MGVPLPRGVARDVAVVCWRSKTESVSLLWELNSIFMSILRKKICCIDHQHNTNITALWRGCKSRIRLGKTRMWKELECLLESRFKRRLQNSRYFCVSKYTLRTNSLTKAENGERGWRETLGFFLPPHTPVGRVRLAALRAWGSYPALFSCKPTSSETQGQIAGARESL